MYSNSRYCCKQLLQRLLPPFRDDVPTVSLLRVSLRKLVQKDETEVEGIATSMLRYRTFLLGFKICSCEALLNDAGRLFSLGEAIFAVPSYLGYNAMSARFIDGHGRKYRKEFFNTSKDDIVGLLSLLPTPELRRSQVIICTVPDLPNAELGLPQTIFGDQVRWMYTPAQTVDDRQKVWGEQTDFDSSYINSLRDHCVANLSDSMIEFTAGALRSNLHRLVNPLSKQRNETGISLVYLSRLEDKIDERRERYWEEIGRKEEETSAKNRTLRRGLGERLGFLGLTNISQSNYAAIRDYAW
ncbi:hypothetical protein K431DRAFT_323856 [Polychaeton citri CBS 116435]|uniref:Uncharacterized protein n=1 Tax=Polychaeton citri CBS 116435 TaxID=1314669 RepID=A0A9P4Q1K0_9PEZI|nr:hypothetical protein K431DRAFT_323856 [Polychaeton citri CBS 116435]